MTCFGFDNKGEFIHESDLKCPEEYNTRSSALWDKFIRLYAQEIKARYSVLRRGNLNMQTVEECMFGEIIDLIGQKFYNMDNESKYLPYEKGYIFMAKGNRAYHIRRWIEERFLYVDTMMGYNAQTKDSVIIRNTMSGEFILKVKTYSPQMVTVDFGGTTSTSDGIQTKYCSDKEWTNFRFVFDGEYQRDISISNAKHIMEIGGLDGQTLLMLDIQYAEKLVSISCKNNPALTQLNTKNCKYLRYIDCSNNTGLVGALDLTGCVNLKELIASNTNITGIDVSTCRNLKKIDISNTKVSSLVLNNNVYLEDIIFNNCVLLSNISLTGCLMLEEFIVHDTGLRDITLIDCDNLTNFDVSNNPLLENVTISNMDGLATVNLSGCPKVKTIIADWCSNLENFDITGCNSIERLNISGTKVSEVSTETLKNLHYLNITDTKISTISIPATNDLETLIVENTPITTLEFYNLKKLKVLNIAGTGITSIRDLITYNLTSLNLSRTQIQEVSFLEAGALEYININGSLITDLNLSTCTALRSLILASKEVDNTILRTLNVSRTPLVTLNLYDSDDMRTPNLVMLTATNMLNLTTVKASKKITSVNLADSKCLETTWSDRFIVPSVLLTVNNMANYTKVTVNDSMLSTIDVEKLKEGTYYIDSDEVTIKVLDGCLAGTVLTVDYIHQDLPLGGLEISNIFPDPLVAEHVRELLDEESVNSKVTQTDLDTIKWFGTNPIYLNVDYKGAFAKKNVTTFRGINYLRNLEYFNIAECNYSGEVKLYFPKLKTLDYSFMGCSNILSVVSVAPLAELTSMKYTFKNATLMSTIILPSSATNIEDVTGICESCLNVTDIISPIEVLNLRKADKAFYGCVNLKNIKVPTVLPNLESNVDMFGLCDIENVTFHSADNISRCEQITLLPELLKSAKKIDFSSLINLSDVKLCEEGQTNTILTELNLSNTKLKYIDFTQGESKVSKLRKLVVDNTPKLVVVKAPTTLTAISLNNSLLLNPPNLDNGIPTLLLSENNLANYTSVKIDGLTVSSSIVNSLKNGTLAVTHNQRIEILDGILAGITFITCIGMPIIELFPDGTVAQHIQELTGKSSVYDIVNKNELNTVTWIGAEEGVDSTQGYFYNRMVTTFEGIEYLKNLQYLNLSRAIFGEIDLSQNTKIRSLNNSFEGCISTEEVRLPTVSELRTMKSTFKGANNLRRVLFPAVLELLTTMESAFEGALNLKELKIPQQIPILNTSTTEGGGLYKTFDGCSITKVEFYNPEEIVDMNYITLMNALMTAVTDFDLSKCVNLEVLKLSNGENYNSKLLTLNISNTKLKNVNLESGTNTTVRSLLYLTARNTEIETLKVRNTIRTVDIEGSEKLTEMLYNFKTTINIPKLLLFENGMANYTSISINGKLLSDDDILALKNGVYDKMADPSIIEVLDGCLQGTVLKVKYYDELPDTGLPLREIFPDSVLCNHIRERVGRASVDDVVTYYDLDRVTWIGTRETGVSSISYFTNKTVTDWRGIEHLRSLTAINLNGVNSEDFYYAYTANSISTFKVANSKFKTVNISKLENLSSLSFAFTYSSLLETVILPKKLDNLYSATATFLDCVKLNYVVFPNSLPKISDMKEIFNGCRALPIFTIPTSMPLLKYLNYAFYGCEALEELIYPDSLPEIYDMQYAMAYCSRLKKVELPEDMPKLINLNSTLLGCSSLDTILFPIELPNVTMLDSTLRLCSSLKTIDITCNFPKLTYMLRVFENCTSLNTLKIRGQMPVINEVSYCFEYVRSLKILDISGMRNSNVSILTGLATSSINELDISHNARMLTLNISSWSMLKKLTAKYTTLTTLTCPQAITHLYIDYSTGLRNFDSSLYPSLIEFTCEGVDIQN